MKRVFIILSIVFSMNSHAEDVLQVMPITTSAGVAYNQNKTIDIYLNNTFDVANLQFDLLVPEGMTLRKSDTYVQFGEHAKIYDDEEEDYINLFTFQTNVIESGYTRFMFIPKGIGSIKTGSGVILKIPYKTDSNMADGVYPILITGINLNKSVTETIKIPSTSSYVIIGNSIPNHADMSSLVGYIPSFVVGKLNDDIASNTNLKSLNLSGTSYANLGADIEVPDGMEMLWYTSDKASLNRTFTADKWSSVCLPVSIEVSSLLGTPLIQKMESYDETGGYISLADVSTIEKGKPYMVKSVSDSKLFNNVSITDCESVTDAEPGSFVSGNLSMKGTYQETTVSSTASKTYYGFSGGKFVGVTVGGTGKAQPFRAYLELNGVATTRSIGIGEDNGTTSINKTFEEIDNTNSVYDLNGMRIESFHNAKGIYIRNGKKEIIK